MVVVTTSISTGRSTNTILVAVTTSLSSYITRCHFFSTHHRVTRIVSPWTRRCTHRQHPPHSQSQSRYSSRGRIVPKFVRTIQKSIPSGIRVVQPPHHHRHYYFSTASESDSNNNNSNNTNNSNTTSTNTNSNSGGDTIISKRIDEINDYIQDQIETMDVFHMFLNMDPRQSHHDVEDFIDCRDRIQYLVHDRIPPNIIDEVVITPSSSSSSSSSLQASTTPTTPLLLHIAIRQSKLYTDLAMAVLRRGYYNAKSHPWMLGWSMMQGKGEHYENPESFYIQRYQGSWRYDIIKRMMPRVPKVGTIIMYDDEAQETLVVEYHRNLRTHFCNAPAFPKSYTNTTSTRPLGTVHVAMGFNDLQILLEHVDVGMEPTNQSSASSSTSNDGHASPAMPMNFIGYDRSTYSIAKTLVIAQMLQQSAVTSHHIIEAWYSSTWNYETFMLFRFTCITLLKDDAYINQQQSIMSYPNSAQEEIRQYLHHWAYDAVPISAVEAVQRWLYASSHQGQVYTQTCSFHRYNDRKSLLQYFTTGEFNSNHQTQSNTEMVGSLAMWSVPDWAPNSNKTDQDRVNNTVLLKSILDEINNHPNQDISIMAAMYNIKLRQVSYLQRAVQNREIQIDIRYGDIKPLHKANLFLVDEICDLKATTMSWSNLVDYFDIGQFHELAHHWSSRNGDGTALTTHYGYTMNWPTTCFGSSISDYHTRKERKKIFFDTIESARQESEENGVGVLVTKPTFEHTEDQTGEFLGRQLRPKWVEYFINEGKTLLPGNQSIVVNDEMQLDSPILRTNRSIYLTWTYH